jgi:hypothetical protein
MKRTYEVTIPWLSFYFIGLVQIGETIALQRLGGPNAARAGQTNA